MSDRAVSTTHRELASVVHHTLMAKRNEIIRGLKNDRDLLTYAKQVQDNVERRLLALSELNKALGVSGEKEL